MSRRKRPLALLAVLGVIASMLAVVNPPQARAQTGWPKDVSYLNPTEQLTGVDGAVHATNCVEDEVAVAAHFFNASGAVSGEVAGSPDDSKYLGFCGETKAADAAGVLYGVWSDFSASGNGRHAIVAHDGSGEVWKEPISDPNPCPGKSTISDLNPLYMEIGADGFLYVISESWYCYNNKYLAKISTSDGETIYNKNVGQAWIDWFGVHDNGIAFFQNDQTLRHISYDGSENTPINVEPGANLTRYARAITADGRVYFDVSESYTPDEACSRSYVTRKIVGYEPTGKVFEYSTPFCERVESVAVTDSHEVAFTTSREYSREYRLMKVADNGVVIQDLPLSKEAGNRRYGYSDYSYPEVVSDTNGNVLLIKTV